MSLASADGRECRSERHRHYVCTSSCAVRASPGNFTDTRDATCFDRLFYGSSLGARDARGANTVAPDPLLPRCDRGDSSSGNEGIKEARLGQGPDFSKERRVLKQSILRKLNKRAGVKFCTLGSPEDRVVNIADAPVLSVPNDVDHDVQVALNDLIAHKKRQGVVLVADRGDNVPPWLRLHLSGSTGLHHLMVFEAGTDLFRFEVLNSAGPEAPRVPTKLRGSRSAWRYVALSTWLPPDVKNARAMGALA